MQAKYAAESLLIQRDQVSREIRMGLEERAEEFHILIEDIAIVLATCPLHHNADIYSCLIDAFDLRQRV